MTLVVEEDVVQLQIAVDDAALVQKVQSETDLSGVEPVVKMFLLLSLQLFFNNREDLVD